MNVHNHFPSSVHNGLLKGPSFCPGAVNIYIKIYITVTYEDVNFILRSVLLVFSAALTHGALKRCVTD